MVLALNASCEVSAVSLRQTADSLSVPLDRRLEQRFGELEHLPGGNERSITPAFGNFHAQIGRFGNALIFRVRLAKTCRSVIAE